MATKFHRMEFKVGLQPLCFTSGDSAFGNLNWKQKCDEKKRKKKKCRDLEWIPGMGTLAAAFNMLRAYCFVCTLFDCNHVKGWGSLAHTPTYSALLLACFWAPQRGWQGVKERTKTSKWKKKIKRTKRREGSLIDQHATFPVNRALQCQYHSIVVNPD